MNTVLDKRPREESGVQLTTSHETLKTTPGSRKNSAIESCGDAIRFTSVPLQILPENSKLHFPLIMKVPITN